MTDLSHRLAAPLLAAALTISVAGCTYLPRTGPSRGEVVDQARSNPALPFARVVIDGNTLTQTQTADEPGFGARFGDGEAGEPTLRVGDVVSLTVFEAGTEPLFANANTANTSRGIGLPAQALALDGSIAVPYAGRVSAAGLTVAGLQTAIEARLARRAAHPQVMVDVNRGAGSSVTVLGESGAGARVPLTAQGERLLDVLTASGGLRGTIYDTAVTLQRGGLRAQESLARLLDTPADNVRLRAGDAVVIARRPRSFVVFGAAGRSAQLEFAAEHLSLSEAVARAGGLDDARADPRGVFLFRYEPAAVAQQLGVTDVLRPEGAPVVYQLDLMQASAYFVAQRFELKDRDVLYVAGARANELQKFLQLVGLISQPVVSGAVLYNSTRQ